MVRVIVELDYIPVDAHTERAVIHCYTVDGDTEQTQGTLRDNRLGKDIEDKLFSFYPEWKRGEPSYPKFNSAMMVWMDVWDARGFHGSHRLGYQRLLPEAKYNNGCSRMMELYRWLECLINRAKRSKEKEDKKKGKRNGK